MNNINKLVYESMSDSIFYESMRKHMKKHWKKYALGTGILAAGAVAGPELKSKYHGIKAASNFDKAIQSAKNFNAKGAWAHSKEANKEILKAEQLRNSQYNAFHHLRNKLK